MFSAEVKIFICGLVTIVALTIEPADKTSKLAIHDLPLTKSLGYSPGNTFHNLEDAQISHEYLEQYQEMLRISRKTYETVNGEGQHVERRDGRRQRHAVQVSSPVGRRRSRLEALRREKLNSQSLRSHLEHTRQSSIEGISKEFNES